MMHVGSPETGQQDPRLKGTTTVGLLCSDGIVVAADKRATYGYFIANKETEKIFKIDDNIAITVAGVVADAQDIVRVLKAQVELFKVSRNVDRMSVKQATVLLSNLMHQMRMFPYIVQLIVAGLDDSPRIYTLDPYGGVTEEKLTSTGSGSPVAYGVLEDRFSENKTVKENLVLAVQALQAAMRRDVATGEFIDLVSITSEGFKKFSKSEVKALMKEYD